MEPIPVPRPACSVSYALGRASLQNHALFNTDAKIELKQKRKRKLKHRMSLFEDINSGLFGYGEFNHDKIWAAAGVGGH